MRLVQQKSHSGAIGDLHVQLVSFEAPLAGLLSAPTDIRAHVFLCMLSYYVEWHLRRDLRPLLFHDEHREAAEQQRHSIVRPAPRSKAAVRKERERRTEDGLPVQSLRCLLGDLATICRNTVRLRSSSATFERVTVPTDSQLRALELLGVTLEAAK